jgi:hypothetical protein
VSKPMNVNRLAVLLLLTVGCGAQPEKLTVAPGTATSGPFQVEFARSEEELEKALNDFHLSGCRIIDTIWFGGHGHSTSNFAVIAFDEHLNDPLKADLLTEELPRPEGK